MAKSRLEGSDLTNSVQSTIDIAVDPFAGPRGNATWLTMHRKLADVNPVHPVREEFTEYPFNPALIYSFSNVLWRSFFRSPEVESYPQLRTQSGCRSMVDQLTDLREFLPDASWVVLSNARPVGCVLSCAAPGGVFGEIKVLTVTPLHRRRGIGEHLIERAMWNFHERGLMHAVFKINHSNRNAIRFLRSMGFQANAAGHY